MVAAIDGDLGMTKAAASLMGAAFLAFGVISLSSAAQAQRWVYPPERVDWKVGPGYFGFSGLSVARTAVRLAGSQADLWLLLHPRAIEERLAAGRSLLLSRRALQANSALSEAVYPLPSFQ